MMIVRLMYSHTNATGLVAHALASRFAHPHSRPDTLTSRHRISSSELVILEAELSLLARVKEFAAKYIFIYMLVSLYEKYNFSAR